MNSKIPLFQSGAGLLLALSTLIAEPASAFAQGTAFTYHGRLNDGSSPANGTYDLTFTLFGTSSGGSVLAGPLTNSPTGVTNGLFTVVLNFGNQFPGADRWLEIAVRTNGPGSPGFTTLAPRQPLTATPYAITAGNLTGVVPASGLSGAYSAAVTFNNPANAFSGSGAGLTNLNASQLTSTVPPVALSNAWKIGGNSGTTPGTHYLGTTDNQPLELNVYGMRALRLEPGDGISPNVIGGYQGNFVVSGNVGSTIGGGGDADYENAIYASFATIAGGRLNAIGANSSFSAIGGGYVNNIAANSFWATIAGGVANAVDTNCYSSAIGGGYGNNIAANSDYTAIGGGYYNNIATNSDSASIAGGVGNAIGANSTSSAIGGGSANSIAANSFDATIAGGLGNAIGTNSHYSAIGGGTNNIIAANAQYASIPGGDRNFATNRAFAAGTRARASHTGAFVWADSQAADFASTATNQFSLRAAGGVRFVTGGAGMSLDGQPVLSGAVTTGQLADSAVTSAKLADGTIAAADVNAADFNTTFWRASGNLGTTPGTHFLGTTDNQPVELKVNGQRALRLEPNTNSPNVIGGYSGNFVWPGYFGSTIGGGGALNYGNAIYANYATIAGGVNNNISFTSEYATIAGGSDNGTSSDHSAIGGGYYNNIAFGSTSATIAGGSLNDIGTISYYSAIGGGYYNKIRPHSHYSTIGGGYYNNIADDATAATIAGGEYNVIGTNSGPSAIGGGYSNNIAAYTWSATIAGGASNDIGTESSFSTIGGGWENNIAAGSEYATIAGGWGNNIGTNSDSCAIGGGLANYIGTNADSCAIGGGANNIIAANAQYATIPGGRGNAATNYAFAAGRRANANHEGSFVWGDSYDGVVASSSSNQFTVRASGGARFFSNTNLTAGVSLAPNGTSWSVISDRNVKKDFAPVDSRGILEKLATLPVTQWHYQWEAASVTPHIGPMAQDFKAAFYPGSDDKSITTQEADGVALAAIQGLNQKLNEKNVEIELLKQRLTDLEKVIHSSLANETANKN
jgi:Chaperone of endosialidase